MSMKAHHTDQLFLVAKKSSLSGSTPTGIYESSYPLEAYLSRALFNALSFALSWCGEFASMIRIALKITGPDTTTHRHKNLNIVFNMEAPL